MDTEQKSRVLRLFLEFIQSYLKLGEATMVTLGGEGREARLWLEAGVNPNKCWLIERDLKRSHLIMKEFPQFEYMNSLEHFKRSFVRKNDPGVGIDAFHLDLCGTIERNGTVEMVKPIIPMIVKSRGRCLAITVADSRYNKSVAKFAKIESRLRTLMGDKYDQLYSGLLAEHQGDTTDLAIPREIGFFNSMIHLLKFYRYSVPNKVVRYSYVSHTSGAPFRMRTYFFHFPNKPQRMSEKVFAKRLFKVWFHTQLQDLSRPAQKRVEIPETLMAKASADKYQDLRKLVETLGGVHEQQFNALQMEAAHKQGLPDEVVGVLSKYITPSGNGLGSAPHIGNEIVRRGKSKKRTKVRKLAPKAKKAKVVQDDGTTLDMQLFMLRENVKGEKKLVSAKKTVAKTLKISRSPNKGNIVGGLWARTQGSHRKGFLKRLVAVKGEAAINDELADQYSKITDKVVTANDLRAEAGL